MNIFRNYYNQNNQIIKQSGNDSKDNLSTQQMLDLMQKNYEESLGYNNLIQNNESNINSNNKENNVSQNSNFNPNVNNNLIEMLMKNSGNSIDSNMLNLLMGINGGNGSDKMKLIAELLKQKTTNTTSISNKNNHQKMVKTSDIIFD